MRFSNLRKCFSENNKNFNHSSDFYSTSDSMLFLFLISYYLSSNIKLQRSYLYLDAFGFLKDGKFEFTFQNAKHQQIFVGLGTSNEISFISTSLLEYNNFTCDVIKQNIYINLSKLITIDKNGFGDYSGVVYKDGSLIPLIVTCSKTNAIHYQNLNLNGEEITIQNNIKSTSYISDYTFSIRFSNPNSLLDSRKIPCLYIKPASIVLFGLLIIFWLINWFFNFTLKNPLHLYLTVTFLVTFLYVIIDTMKLYHDNVSDDPTPLSTVFIVLRCLHELLLLTAMMLAAKGWCIIIETIEIKEIILSFFYAVLFSFPIIILDTQVLNVYLQLTMFMIGFGGCFLYYNVLITSIAEANSVVSAHLLIISQSGIDPETTPIQKKFHIFNTISNSVVLYFSIMMFRTVLYELIHIPDYIMTIIYDLATFALLTVAAWLFKLKKSLRNGYMMVGENAESVEFTLDDIEKLNEDRDEIQKGATTPWQEGMPLPAQPIVHKHSNGKNIDADNNRNTKNEENLNPLELNDDKKDKNETENEKNNDI